MQSWALWVIAFGVVLQLGGAAVYFRRLRGLPVKQVLLLEPLESVLFWSAGIIVIIFGFFFLTKQAIGI